MTAKQSNSSANLQAKLYNSLLKKIGKEYLLTNGKKILSLPIPLSYEIWRGIHQEVEKLEKELEE